MVNLLPEDIMLDIIVRLPTKAIGRFRCVSKTWCERLSGRSFEKMHLNHVTRLQSFGSVLDNHLHINNEIFSIHFDPLSFTCEGLVCMMNPLRFNRRVYAVRVLGYCNGLVCTRSDNSMTEVFLWNPCTREFITLPMRPLDSSKVISYIEYGFGYDSKTEDYKVVSLAGYKYDRYYCEVQLYTLRSNSWRIRNSIAYNLSSYTWPEPKVVNGSHQLTVDGALHWIAKSSSTISAQGSKVMISFDFEKDFFEEIPLPNLLSETFTQLLYVVAGTLCLLDFKDEVGFELWESKDYGGGKSWNKIFTIDSQQIHYGPSVKLTPWQFLRYGEIILPLREPHYYKLADLVLHDPERGTSVVLEDRDLEAYLDCKSVFSGSLVSLNSKTCQRHPETEESEDVVGLRDNEYWKNVVIIYWKYRWSFSIIFLGWFLIYAGKTY